jgi:hypothetical protein
VQRPSKSALQFGQLLPPVIVSTLREIDQR